MFDLWMQVGPLVPKNIGIGEQIDCWNAFRKGWNDKLARRSCLDGCGYVGASRNAYDRGRFLALTPAAYRPRDNGRFVASDGYDS
jgi:hypothetical protein